MTKIIIINSCTECPKRAVKFDEDLQGYHIHICNYASKLSDKEMTITDINSIPGWCPLSNYRR